MKKRIMILTGAGFTASHESFGISTSYLTEQVKSMDIDGIQISKTTPGAFLAKILEEYFGRYLDFPGNEQRYVNFETILNILEELYTYALPLKSLIDFQFDKNNPEKLIEIGMKPALYEIKNSIMYPLWEAASKYNSAGRRKKRKFDILEGIRPLIKSIYISYIEWIANELKSKSTNANVEPMIEFRGFLRSNMPKTKFVKRLYTLNYDYWLPANSKKDEFYDGFSNGKFDLKISSENFEKNCHLNLHGAANWKFDLKTGQTIQKKRGEMTYDDLNLPSQYLMSKDALIISPIISGYNKSARISFSPFLEIYNSFSYDIQNCDMLIIIGYGFGDLHINNLIKTTTAPVVIIDKKTFPSQIEAHLSFLNGSVFNGKTKFSISRKKDGFYYDKGYKVYFGGLDTDGYAQLKLLLKQL